MDLLSVVTISINVVFCSYRDAEVRPRSPSSSEIAHRPSSPCVPRPRPVWPRTSRPSRLLLASIVEDDRCFRVFKSSVQYNLLREFPSPRWRSCSSGFAISIIPFLVRIPVLFIHQRPYSRLQASAPVSNIRASASGVVGCRIYGVLDCVRPLMPAP